MNEKVEIISTAINGDWCNAKLIDGSEISINIKSNPNLAKHLANGDIPLSPIEMNVVVKNGKKYGWDIKEQKSNGGGNKWQPSPEQIAAKQQAEDLKQRMIIAQSSLSASVQFYQQRGQVDIKTVKETAKEFYNFVLETSK